MSSITKITVSNDIHIYVISRKDIKMKENWKEKYEIQKKQYEIAEEIKTELLKKAQTEHQRNIIKETINEIKRKYRI